MNKIAIVSDIHGNLPALEEVVKDFKRRGAEIVFNLGDHISGPLWPKETLQYLMKQDWIHIKGNHDRQLYEEETGEHGASDAYAHQFLTQGDLNWLESLPAVYDFNNEFLLFHGAPSHDKTYLLETVENGRVRLAELTEIKERLYDSEQKILICGHTHVPRVVEAEGKMIINAGSVGLQAYDDVEPEYHVIEVGSPHARYVLMEKIEGKWTAEIIAVNYDFKKAAQQAAANGRPDWEAGLLKGYL